MESDALILFASFIHDDFLIDYPDFFSGVPTILGYLAEADRVNLFNSIESILNKNLSPYELADVWNGLGSGLVITPGDSEAFFKELLAYDIKG